MRKFVAIIGAVAVIGATASAVDMGGRIGFGVGPSSGSSILIPSVFGMRMGVGPVVIEPSVVYSSDVTDDKIDSIKTSYSNMGVGVRGLFPFLKGETANLYGTFGFSFDMPKTICDYYSTGGTKMTTSGTVYSVFFGLALERFINPNFSVCVSSEGSYSGSSSKEEWESAGTTQIRRESSTTDLFFGNTSFSLMFFWYLSE